MQQKRLFGDSLKNGRNRSDSSRGISFKAKLGGKMPPMNKSFNNRDVKAIGKPL